MTDQERIDKLEDMLRRITEWPYGCVFCNSGNIINKAKGYHEDGCAFDESIRYFIDVGKPIALAKWGKDAEKARKEVI